MMVFAFSILQTSVPEKIVRRLALRKTNMFQPLNRTIPKGRKSTGTERKRENGEKWAADGRTEVHRSRGQCVGIVWVFQCPEKVERRVNAVGWRLPEIRTPDTVMIAT
jgi:hypothetical protein